MSKSSAGDSRVRTSASRGSARASQAPGAGSGGASRTSFAHYDPASSSWRTSQVSFQWSSATFSETWPKWGSLRSGVCSLRPTWEPHTFASGSFSSRWPTPNAAKASDDLTLTCSGDGRSTPNKLGWAVTAECKSWPTPTQRPNRSAYNGAPLRLALEQLVDPQRWPTPTASAGNGPQRGQNAQGSAGLEEMVKSPRWPTPSSSDEKGSSKPGQRRRQLSEAIETRWPTPTWQAAAGARTATSTRPADSSHHDGTTLIDALLIDMGHTGQVTDAVAAMGGRLNPAWVEALMGFPVGWTQRPAGPPAGASPSTRGSRRASRKSAPTDESA